MGNMRFKVGDRVRIKSLDWFRNEGINIFNTFMTKYYGEVVTIKSINNGFYRIKEDGGQYCWIDEMFECKMEEESKPELKFKVGDKVRIKSIHWYNENKDAYSCVHCGDRVFDNYMSVFCGSVVTIGGVSLYGYDIREDLYCRTWTDEMFEELVEEETKSEFKVGDKITNGKTTLTILTLTPDRYLVEDNFGECGILYFNSQDGWKIVEEETKPKYEDEVNGEYYSTPKYLVRPSGYQFVDENGNIINAQKIVLEKKHNEKLKLESTKKVREYWSEYTRIYIEIYDDEPNECVLTHLYTIEGHRQKGYGKQALIEAESIAKELGCHTVYLKVETNSWMYEWYLRMGYKWYKTVNKEYTWLAKNLTGMEKKKKEYPKTYEECCTVLRFHYDHYLTYDDENDINPIKEEEEFIDLMDAFSRLIVCRNAYWKLAGKEMGLRKPWEQRDSKVCYGIITVAGEIQHDTIAKWRILTFPTEEMRDAFYENFKELIESCKELL